MPAFIDWAADLLMSRGALVETGEDGVLRAMLSRELASALGCEEWLSLRLAGWGSDDENDWLDRLGKLIPPDARIIGARLRRPRSSSNIDCARVLDRELVIQNGIYRLPEDCPATARYYFFSFRYTIESDETSLGVWTACLNASARSLVHRPESLLDAIRDDIEEDPAFAIDQHELTRLFPVAMRLAQSEVRHLAVGIEHTANRRIARDSERVNTYYRDLLRQIEKRVARHGSDLQAVEKERSRAAATQLDRAAKLDDLARKYSLKIRIEPADVLTVSLPVRAISARVIRKKMERTSTFHWNTILSALDSPWCESCFDRAYPMSLCDGRVHFLCKSCLAACPVCGNQYCAVCGGKCRCSTVARA